MVHDSSFAGCVGVGNGTREAGQTPLPPQGLAGHANRASPPEAPPFEPELNFYVTEWLLLDTTMNADPELFLPSQIERSMQQTCLRERRLWGAVLEDALAEAQKPSPVNHKRKDCRSVPDEARAWIADPSDEVGSFVWVCRTLLLEPEAVRNALNDRVVKPRRRHHSTKYELTHWTHKVTL